MIKNMDPFKKVELKDKVNNYKANLTKLIRIDEAKHYYNYFLAYKKNLLQTWDGTWETININIKSSKEINYLQVNNKTITGIKDIVNEFNIHSFTIAKKFKKKKKKKKKISSQSELTHYLPQPNQALTNRVCAYVTYLKS